MKVDSPDLLVSLKESSARIIYMGFYESQRMLSFICAAYKFGIRGSKYTLVAYSNSFVDPYAESQTFPKGCTRDIILEQYKIIFWVGNFEGNAEPFRTKHQSRLWVWTEIRCQNQLLQNSRPFASVHLSWCHASCLDFTGRCRSEIEAGTIRKWFPIPRHRPMEGRKPQIAHSLSNLAGQQFQWWPWQSLKVRRHSILWTNMDHQKWFSNSRSFICRWFFLGSFHWCLYLYRTFVSIIIVNIAIHITLNNWRVRLVRSNRLPIDQCNVLHWLFLLGTLSHGP